MEGSGEGARIDETRSFETTEEGASVPGGAPGAPGGDGEPEPEGEGEGEGAAEDEDKDGGDGE